MKKNRPGVMISVLCTEDQIPALELVLFRETGTLGVRRYPVSRHKLKRQSMDVETPYGPVRGKLGWLEDRPPAFSPEYDDCAGSPLPRRSPARGLRGRSIGVYSAQRITQSRADRRRSSIDILWGWLNPNWARCPVVPGPFFLRNAALCPIA